MIGAFGEVYVLDWGIAASLEDDPGGRLPSVNDVSSPAGRRRIWRPKWSVTTMALALDRRVFWAAIPHVVCVVIASFVPDDLLYIFAGTNVLAMGLLAWRLWPRDEMR